MKKDIEVLKAIDEVLKLDDINSVKSSIILNRIRSIMGVKLLEELTINKASGQ